MGALAGLFGGLGALGNLGAQKAEATDAARDELVKRLATAQQQRTSALNEKLLQQKVQQGEFTAETERQPTTLGNPFVARGKTWQRMQNPVTGEVSLRELPGGPPETAQETMYRGLTAIGLSEEDASQTVVRKLTGRQAEHREVRCDASGCSAYYYDADGNLVWQAATAPPRSLIPSETTRTGFDIFGNPTTSTSIRRPLLGGLGGAPAAPQSYLGGVGSPGAPGVQGGPAAPRQGGVSAPRPTSPPARTGTGRSAPPAPAPTSGTGKSAPPAAGQPLTVGTYRGLTWDGKDGAIPDRPGLNPLVRQFATDLIQGQDTAKIPVQARGAAESVARAYGWKGQGSLTPKEQLQIQEADVAVVKLMDPKLLGTLGGFSGFWMSGMTPDAPESSTGRMAYHARKALLLNSRQQAFLDQLNYVRSLMGGLRKITGGNASEAQMGRYLTDLPDPATTVSYAEARYKMGLLHKELTTAMKYGYFPKGDDAAPGAGGGGGEIQPGTQVNF
jgi:hypothetical protein